MSTIVTRAGKGSALTHTEVDANFTNLNTDKIEAAQSVTLTNKTLGSGTAITAGTINGATIGATTPSSGAFTTLSATGVTTVQAGTAAAPAITTSGDTNTGIFFPAADTIAFAEGGAEAMRIDSSGNVGLGVTPSPWTIFKALEIGAVGTGLAGAAGQPVLFSNAYYNGGWKYAANGIAANYDQLNGAHRFFNAASGTAGNAITFTQAMTLDASGNFAVGISPLVVGLQRNIVFGNADTNGVQIRLQNSTTGSTSTDGVLLSLTAGATPDAYLWNYENAAIIFGTNNTERARITSGGDFLVGTTNNAFNAGAGFKVKSDGIGHVINSSANQNSYHYFNENATNNGYRFYVNYNGGIYNYSGNNSNLSDERTKTNIEMAGKYLDKICAIPVKLFNYKDESENEQKTLGVIAQDVESVAPEFVNNVGWEGETPEDGVPLKSIYTTDMMFGLMKAIQEQQALITQLQAEVAALKGTA